jgi:hypothetical protein
MPDIFKPKFPIWVNFGGPWNRKCWYILLSFEYFEVILYIIRAFGNVVVIWYIFPRFGILCQEKSGNPASLSNGALRKVLKSGRH